ncbi:hypothetical protein A8H39_00400 [Paraburkholderia fungorum]|uniref:hypothetical protein n=1 Tax=Paraburkholderia fungorum TaxID=134537 RepID=UPI000481B0CC|nr:hypothetical protein [Paraburkholderia fungorum]PNE59644.1 hypothetical protein A8H39_00400 [Paraburkholderia fungorum]
MSRNWENVYANLGDATDCLRDAVRTLRKELPSAAPGSARGTPTVDVKANLEQRIAQIQEVIRLVEQDRSDFYVSHTAEVRSARSQSNFLFGTQPAEA